MILTSITGVSFPKTKAPPTGKITFKHEPTNTYNTRGSAVSVLHEGIHIGWIPDSNPDLQDAIIDELSAQRTINVIVEKYRFKDGDNWNDDDKGILHELKLKLKLHVGYEKDGKTYVPITKLLSHLNPEGSIDGLLRWACDAGSFDYYKKKLQRAADKGTELHKSIERQLNEGIEPKELPGYLKDRKFVEAEKTVFDDIGVAGQVDAIFEDRTVDWKSSKKPTTKHKLQVAFACKNTGKEIGEVVTFGGTAKRGYSVCTINKKEIDALYEVIELLAKIYYKLNPRESQLAETKKEE